jgi:dipeptidyl aminopeptidase/acylaminoacyl peptidase
MTRQRGFRTSKALVLSLAVLLSLVPTFGVRAQERYKRPPKAVMDILDAPVTPLVSVSPSRDRILLIDVVRYPPIADLAQPMLRLAGLRINPDTNGRHHPLRVTALTLKTIANGKEVKIALPHQPYAGFPSWAPDGRSFAFVNYLADGIELWIGDAANGSVRRVPTLRLNGVLGDPIRWMPDGHTLLCHSVVRARGRAPVAPRVPLGPNIQESYGKPAPVRTYQDLLQDPHDEDLFDFYATAQLVAVDTRTLAARAIGKPAIYDSTEVSPDGRHLLVERLHKPYSYLLPVFAFPREVEIWDRTGRLEHKLASLPLADQVPIDGVPTGPRDYEWRQNEPATLVWVEALDGGNPKTKVARRDRLLMLRAPFKSAPSEVALIEQRYAGLTWGEKTGLALLRDYDRDRLWVRSFMIDVDHPDEVAKLIWDRSIRDRYQNPGTPVMRTLASGARVMMQDGDTIFLTGDGASPKGDRPFLDRFYLSTLKSERLFQCDDASYESVIALVAGDGSQFITRHETPTEPPNYFLRAAGNSSKKALTGFPDPTPQLRAIKKQLVTYKRDDGVQLSFTLYLPPDYKEGERLPTVIWAYPLEFNDPATAGQVSGSPNRFTTISGISHLFFLTQGYAVLDGATMPVVGDPETMNNTYVEQIVASAKAAIDKAVEMGVTDRNRVGVGGHSYGAFMTANLLAHSDLFRAGIARSGAYNRTLTPFGFQNERRTLWEAPDLYFKISPFMFANKINEPILLIHGEADNNSGTFPIQSERMYQALKGNGGNVRYVTLPFEAHGYIGRESVEHTLWEMINWFDKHVKNAGGEQSAGTQSSR